MPSSPPVHLHFSNHLDSRGTFVPSAFSVDECIYRSYVGNKKYPKEEFFSEISSKDIDNGISVNRGFYCKSPEDVLWRNEHTPVDDTIPSCNYTLRNSEVIYSIYKHLVSAVPPPKVLMDIQSTWVKCNVAHCDIIISPNISGLPKTESRDVRLFLSSLFKDVG